MEAGTAIAALGLSGLVAALVAITKALWPGEMPARAVVATVGAWTAVLLVLAATSGQIAGTPYELFAQWVLQAAGAMGLREGLANTPGIGAAATSLYSRGTGS